MGIPRQESWNGLLFPPPGYLAELRTECVSCIVGTIAGLLSPVISYLLTGMPSSAILPFMCIELMSYGMISGMIRGTKLPAVLKVLCIQAGGRMLRIAAILVCSYIFCIRTVSISSYIDTIGRGTIGIIIQLCLISALALITKKKEQK